MLLSNMDQLSEAYLASLCTDGCPESSSLDFKRDLPGNSDKDKHELLKDVCALANSDGGDLVYGIDEVNGVAGTLSPLTGEAADAATRRISQVLDAGLEPRVHGIQMRPILVSGGYALVLRVPASYDGPHCIRINNARRFVMRNGTNTMDLSFDQLRGAFDRTATLGARARIFIEQRTSAIASGKAILPLAEGPAAIAHFVPMMGLSGRHAVDMKELHAKTFPDFQGRHWGGASRAFNLDGLVVHPGGRTQEGTRTYTQIFRNGSLEFSRIVGAQRDLGNGTPKNILFSTDMTYFYRNSLGTFIHACKSWGIQGPAVAGFSLLHIPGYQIGLGGIFNDLSDPIFDRQNLILPEIWIEELSSVDVDEIVKPAMDILWQAFGLEGCLDYDDQGNFKPRT
jgi:hypothetical protein